jgi:transcriptional regulator with XRE-family HTH domain
VDDLEDVPDVKVFIRPIPLPKGSAHPTALKRAMDAAGLSYREVAELSGVSKPTIGNLANAKGGVERRKADAIAAALDLPMVHLFQHGDGMPPA